MQVSEIFGPTVQGEGPRLGTRCAFVRLGRCNLDCVWCDTPYTWDWRGKNGTVYDPAVELSAMSVDKVVDEVARLGVHHVVVTGGEPLVQRGTAMLLAVLTQHGYTCEVETNGTVPPWTALRALLDSHDMVHVNVSPKLAHSGVADAKRLRPQALTAWASYAKEGLATFKFVARAALDLDEVAHLQREYALPSAAIWVMPEGRTAARVVDRFSQGLAEAVVARGWNLTTRLQVLTWGDRRGV